MSAGRRLLCSRLIDVWVEEPPDPDTEPLSFRGLRQDIEASVDRAVASLLSDPMIKQVGASVEVSEG